MKHIRPRRKFMRSSNKQNQQRGPAGRRMMRMEMRKKLRKLQRLIPGGVKLREANSLFVHTANYIMLLKLQVRVLQALEYKIKMDLGKKHP